MMAGLYCVCVKLTQLTGIHSGVHLSLLAAKTTKNLDSGEIPPDITANHFISVTCAAPLSASSF